MNSVCCYWLILCVTGLPGGSVNKEFFCNAGDPGLIPGSGRSPREGHSNPLQYSCLGNPSKECSCWIPWNSLLGFPESSVGKGSTCNAEDPGLIPGWGRANGEGIGYPLQYSGLENSMDYCPQGGKESDTTELLSRSLSFTGLLTTLSKIFPSRRLLEICKDPLEWFFSL